MVDALAARLARVPFVILDGGLATELEVDGCNLDDPLWSARILLDAPERIRAVHARYVAAGADVLASASYQATIPGLVAAGLSEAGARAMLGRSVELARAAANADLRGTPASAQQRDGAPALVAASIGSYGAYLADGSEYRGDYGLDRAALVTFHRARLDALVAAGPDLLAFETIPSAVEAEAIAELLGARAGPRAWVSFSLRPEPGARPQISDGTPLDEAIAPLCKHPRIAAVGVNCLGPGEVRPALEYLRVHAGELALVAYPNSGERWQQRGWAGQARSPEGFAKLARTWLDAGATLIGGCCRTGPAHIAALVELRASCLAG